MVFCLRWNWASISGVDGNATVNTSSVQKSASFLITAGLQQKQSRIHTWVLNYCWGKVSFAFPSFSRPFLCYCALFANRWHIDTIIYLKVLEGLTNRVQTWKVFINCFGLLVQIKDLCQYNNFDCVLWFCVLNTEVQSFDVISFEYNIALDCWRQSGKRLQRYHWSLNKGDLSLNPHLSCRTKCAVNVVNPSILVSVNLGKCIWIQMKH